MTTRSQFVQQSIIGLGFINGVILKFGTDTGPSPKNEMFASFAELIAVFSQQYAEWFTIGINIISIALLAIAVITAYFKGGSWGVLAVLLAFAGGFLLGAFGAALLILAMVIGFFACRSK